LSETMVSSHITTQCLNLEEHDSNIHRHGTLNSLIKLPEMC